MNYIITLLIALLFTMVSCKKEATSPEFIDKPVIESYLQAGSTASVNVSRLIAFSSSAEYSTDNLDNLLMTITANNISYTLQPQGSGNYSASNPSLIVSEGVTYNLNLLYNKKNVTATTIVPPAPTGFAESVTTMSISQRHSGGGGFSQGTADPDPVKLTWNNPDNSYYLVLTEVISSSPTPIDTSANAQPRAFRGSPLQSNTTQLNARQFQYYGMHRLILFHLNPDYASLYGGSSNNSNNLTNSSTSVVNGAGIFTGINSDTLLINIIKQ